MKPTLRPRLPAAPEPGMEGRRAAALAVRIDERRDLGVETRLGAAPWTTRSRFQAA